MKLTTLMTDKRKEILDEWLSLILNTYPRDSATFMRRQPNRFANPVGHAFAREVEHIFDALVGDSDPQIIGAAVKRINKIRAVQDFSPSQAVAYVFYLKTAIRKVLQRPLEDRQVAEQLLSLESRIDEVALQSFDSYMECRETLFEIRCRDIRRRASFHRHNE